MSVHNPLTKPLVPPEGSRQLLKVPLTDNLTSESSDKSALPGRADTPHLVLVRAQAPPCHSESREPLSPCHRPFITSPSGMKLP